MLVVEKKQAGKRQNRNRLTTNSTKHSHDRALAPVGQFLEFILDQGDSKHASLVGAFHLVLANIGWVLCFKFVAHHVEGLLEAQLAMKILEKWKHVED